MSPPPSHASTVCATGQTAQVDVGQERTAAGKLVGCAAGKLVRGGKIVYCERKGNIRVDVRARGRAKRSAPRKAAACAPGGTEGQ